MDEPGPETRGAMSDGPAATVAMSRATWAAIVVRVCGRCGVVGGLVRDVGGSNRDVGGPSMVGRYNKPVQYGRESALKSRAEGGKASLDIYMYGNNTVIRAK